MYKLTSLLLILLFSFTACQNRQVTAPVEKPSWINSPKKGEQIGAVGSAMPHFNGKTAQRRLAISRALDELAQQNGVQVKSTILRNEKRVGKQTKSSAEVFTIQSSANTTIHAHIEKAWADPRTEEIYIWLLAD